MSSRTPEECVALATDESADEAAREAAIDELKLAHECDELAALVRREATDDGVRTHALRALAIPQCDATLEELVAAGALSGPLASEAEALLEDAD